jgi:PmbA protein
VDVNQFKTALFAKGQAAGFSEMEIYFQSDRETTVRVFKGEIDAYNIAEKAGLSFRGLIDGRMGYSFTERLDEESIDLLLREAEENARIIESEAHEELFGGSESYAELADSRAIADCDPQLLIEAALTMERVALAVDPRVDMVNYCVVVKNENEVHISNTKGLDCHKVSAAAVGYVSAVAKQDGDITSGVDYFFAVDDLANVDVEQVARQAAEQAVAKLGGQTIESDNYTVILQNKVAADLLKSFSSVFSGEAALKGLSLLQGKVGEQVAGSNVTIVDDPHLPGGPGSTPFDAEGMATARHEVIRDGKLVTFLHNLKSARKAGVASTGNAVKASYRSPVTVMPSNLYLVPGEQSLEQLIAGTERGILLVELQGLHAGTNAVSGDFSLYCSGHLIENGQLVRPVNQITVSGNFLGLLKNVEALGNDLRFSGFGSGACGSPSLKIKSLSIAGK